MSTQRKNSKKSEIKKEIKKAVDQLPELIVKQAEHEAGPKHQNNKQYYHGGRDKRLLMWLGVILVTAVIIFFWSLNILAVIKDSSQKPITDGLADEAKQQFQKVQDILKQNEEAQENDEQTKNENMKQILKESLGKLFENFSSSTTSSTTTNMLVTSSTLSITTTSENNAVE